MTQEQALEGADLSDANCIIMRTDGRQPALALARHSGPRAFHQRLPDFHARLKRLSVYPARRSDISRVSPP